MQNRVYKFIKGRWIVDRKVNKLHKLLDCKRQMAKTYCVLNALPVAHILQGKSSTAFTFINPIYFKGQRHFLLSNQSIY